MNHWLRTSLKALHLEVPFAALQGKDVPKHRTSIFYYLGGLALMFFVVQVVTGVLLLFYYEPSVAGAHRSVERIMTKVPFGWLMRSVHSWGANIVIAVMLLHMFTTYFVKSYRSPRHLMWLTGIVILLLMLGFAFTGYLLPWDETAYFATRIGAEVPREIPLIGEYLSAVIKGAPDVSGPTLTRLFALHVALLPIISILIVVAHVTMVALFGVSTPIGAKVKSTEKYFSSYIIKEMVVWFVGFGLLILIATLYPWELGKAYDMANPTEPPAGVHPEWYFMFLFQTLRLVPEWAALIIFGGFLVYWTLVPFLDRHAEHDRKSPIYTILGILGILFLSGLTVWAYISVGEEQAAAQEKVTAAQVTAAPATDMMTEVSLFLVAIAFACFALWLWRKYKLRTAAATAQ
jgi:cytochrome b6